MASTLAMSAVIKRDAAIAGLGQSAIRGRVCVRLCLSPWKIMTVPRARKGETTQPASRKPSAVTHSTSS